jgi:sarcosine oxidase subunit alpha
MALYAVRPGRRAVVLAANDMGYGAALDLADAGVDVAAIVAREKRLAAPWSRLPEPEGCASCRAR